MSRKIHSVRRDRRTVQLSVYPTSDHTTGKLQYNVMQAPADNYYNLRSFSFCYQRWLRDHECYSCVLEGMHRSL